MKKQDTKKNPLYILSGAKPHERFQTFSKTLADLAFECKGTGEEVWIEWKENAQFKSKDILQLIRASELDAPPRDEDYVAEPDGNG